MKKTALDAFLGQFHLNGGWLTHGVIEYENYIFQYAGSYYGYVWEKAKDGLEETDTEHEYGWRSFEEFLNDTMTEVGMTFREVLAAVPAEEIIVLE